MIYITTRDYKTTFKGYELTVPAGSKATDMTACGPDEDYRFWVDFHNVAKELTGHISSGLSHDLTYYGLNIPKEYFA